jgi:hypothetical protein
MARDVPDDRVVGSFYVHRHTGQILRVLRAHPLGYHVLLGGLGRIFLSRRALHASYSKAAVHLPPERRTLAGRSRVEGTLTLTLRPVRHGHELLVECKQARRSERMRFVDAEQALYWFEKLRSFAEFRALVETAPGD